MLFNKQKKDKTEIARKLCSEVRDMCDKYGMPFFFVTDGASATSNDGNPAIKHARDSHKEWEKENNIDSEHDWEKKNKK